MDWEAFVKFYQQEQFTEGYRELLTHTINLETGYHAYDCVISFIVEGEIEDVFAVEYKSAKDRFDERLPRQILSQIQLFNQANLLLHKSLCIKHRAVLPFLPANIFQIDGNKFSVIKHQSEGSGQFDGLSVRATKGKPISSMFEIYQKSVFNQVNAGHELPYTKEEKYLLGLINPEIFKESKKQRKLAPLHTEVSSIRSPSDLKSRCPSPEGEPSLTGGKEGSLV